MIVVAAVVILNVYTIFDQTEFTLISQGKKKHCVVRISLLSCFWN